MLYALIVILFLVLALLLCYRFSLFPKVRQAVAAKKAEKERINQERREQEAAERLRLEKEKKEQEWIKREQKQAAENLLQDFLQNNPYIAISDWKYLKQQIAEVCPFFQITDDILTKQNSTFKLQQKEDHKEYFDTLLTYPLDEQQRDAIVTLGENRKSSAVSSREGGL